MRVVVLPFSRQRWLYAASSSGQITAPAVRTPTAGGFVAWAKDVLSSATQKAQTILQRQWDGLEQSPNGSIKNRLYRMAVAVLAREDVTESFLKTIPTNVVQLQIIAPADQPIGSLDTERYVRRRMRLMLRQQERLHQCRMVSWLGAIVPSAPLAVLPVPNIPMYYAGYRAWSHWKALKGARQALGLFQQAELAHFNRLRDNQSRPKSSEGASPSLVYPVVVCTTPDLDEAAHYVSGNQRDDQHHLTATGLAEVAAQYDLPDLQDFFQRVIKQDRPK